MAGKDDRLYGAVALEALIMEQGLSAAAFARKHSLDQSELSKLIRGVRVRVSVETADRIQQVTKGKIQWRMWIPKWKP